MEPVLEGLRAESHGPFVGVLYAGLMLTDGGAGGCWSTTCASETPSVSR